MCDKNKEDFGKEYGMCFDNWRFFVGLRFTVLAFFITLNSGLLYAYFGLMGEDIKKLFMVFPPIVGVISVLAGWIIENRTSDMYFACLQRAKAIELKAIPGNENAIKVRWARLFSLKKEWPYIQKKEKIDVKQEAEMYNLATLLDNRCPITMFSSQKLGIRIVYGMFLFLWIMMLIASIYLYCKL
jgi:hypothetical protein